MKHKSIQINQIPKPAKVSWLLVLFLIQTMIYGQGRNERVTIVGAFEPNLRPATKILINPAEQAFVADTSNQPYTNIGPKYSTAVSMPAIAWSQVKTDERPQFNRNYLDAALGSRLSPRFLFSHHSKLSKKTGFDLNLQHQSSWTDIQDFAPSSWMHNNAAVATASATGNYVWTNRLFYDHRLVHFYGFEPADFPTAVVEAADIRQQYQLASLSSQLKSNDKQSDALHHEIGFQYHYWQDRFSNREQLVTVKGNANKSLDLLQVDGAQEFAADAQFDFCRLTTPCCTQGFHQHTQAIIQHVGQLLSTGSSTACQLWKRHGFLFSPASFPERQVVRFRRQAKFLRFFWW